MVYTVLNEGRIFWNTIVKQAIYKKYDGKCYFCTISNNTLCVHHTDYNNITIHTLILLCRGCHKAVHKHTLEKISLIKSDILSNIPRKDIVCKYGISYRFLKAFRTRLGVIRT